jgi:hypothetical protein
MSNLVHVNGERKLNKRSMNSDCSAIGARLSSRLEWAAACAVYLTPGRAIWRAQAFVNTRRSPS